MEERNPGVFRASCLYWLMAAGLWATSFLTTAFWWAFTGMNEITQSFCISSVYYALFCLIPVLFTGWGRPGMLRANPLSVANTIRVCIMALLTVMVAEYGVTLWSGVLQKFGLNVFAETSATPGNRSELLISLAEAAVIAPICEEMMFRGALLTAWEPRGSKKAIWVTAILFAGLHGSLTGLPAHLFVGVLLATLVLYTDSLYAGLIFHTVYNAALTILNYTASSDAAEEALMQADLFAALGSANIITMLIEMAVFLLIIRALVRQIGRGHSLRKMLKNHSGSGKPADTFEEFKQLLKQYSPLHAATDTRPLRISTIFVLMAGFASAVVFYIADVVAML